MARTVEPFIAKDQGELANSVARMLADLTQTTGAARVSVALAGGSTPRRLYETLATPRFRDEVLWHRLELFFGDERAVAPDHDDSNYAMAEAALFSKVDVAVHRMRAAEGEAVEYENLIRQRIAATTRGNPAFDLILLGMGNDGHTASLFPNTQALDERSRLVVMNEVPQLHTRRMTFTYPLLNAARRVWILAPGAAKGALAARCMAAQTGGRFEPQWPVTGVAPTDGELTWWIDEASAAAAQQTGIA